VLTDTKLEQIISAHFKKVTGFHAGQYKQDNSRDVRFWLPGSNSPYRTTAREINDGKVQFEPELETFQLKSEAVS
jgi:hypothetical protein